VRIVPPILIATLVCLGLSGCAMFKRATPAKPPSGPDPLFPRADRTNPAPPADVRTAAAAEASPVVPTSAASGILAGQVIDSFSRPPGEAYILVSFPKEGAAKDKKPIEVQTNAQGYFTIAGLQPGKHYQLIARCRDGKRMLAGTTFATPPNPRVVIKISEDFVNKNTPPIPPPPVWPGSKEEKAEAPAADNTKADLARAGAAGGSTSPSWNAPARIDGPDGGFDHGPAGTNVTPPVAIGTPEPDPSRIAQAGSLAKNDTVAINPQGGPRPTPTEKWIPGREADSYQVPSCVFANNQLVNFTLNDVDDRPYSFRYRRGKLVLLDFWATWCLPCRQTIPHLRILQERYGAAGLEVVGITYEGYGSLAEQKRKIQDVCLNRDINYKVLVGSPGCPVKTKFGVRAFPTLILLDENGRVIWRHQGALEPAEVKDLETRIQSGLGGR